jgi:hypothetical protein
MKYGSVRRSISLPTESMDDGYSPDGLSESDIDELLSQAGVAMGDTFADDEDAPDMFLSLVDEQQLPAAPNASEAA